MSKPRSTAPKYARAYRAILQRLKSGHFPVGGRIPTEDELASRLRMSRVTVRRALSMLVQDGYVQSRQGSGYWVITLSPASDTCLTSFTDAMLRLGREPKSRFLSLQHFAPGAIELAHLPEAMRERHITRVSRLRLVDGEPQMLVKTYAPTELLQDAKPSDFPEVGPQQSILRILSDRFKLLWSAACEDISPVAADIEMAASLKVSNGQPILKQACSAFADDGAVVFHEDVFRNGAVSFTLTRKARTQRHV